MTLEVFRISKFLSSLPLPVYESEDLRGVSIDGQFYAEDLTPFKITKRIEYLVDTILDKRVSRGICEHLVSWRR